jgi:hypothetical protein
MKTTATRAVIVRLTVIDEPALMLAEAACAEINESRRKKVKLRASNSKNVMQVGLVQCFAGASLRNERFHM